MSIHEECGVFGAFFEKPFDAAQFCYYGLYALQHRGQESCGIVVNDDGLFSSHKDLGLVGEVFTKSQIAAFPKGTMAVGHTRYGTTGGTNRRNCQPIEVNHQKGRMALAHNGNLSNAAALRNALELSGAIFHTTSDTETIAYIITKERLRASSIEDAVSAAMNSLDGAYSLILMSPQKLICVRDPFGFRPLCFGKTSEGVWVVASESCALNAVGAKLIRDVEPGEILVFGKNGITSRREHCKEKSRKTCIFEYIYFARPDSVIDGISVQRARLRAGEILAEEYPVPADIVIGVPDSGIDAAVGYSRTSGIPYGVGLIKNKYIGRTFISPGDRMNQVRIKLSATVDAVKGKRVVLIDDSIVRGTTLRGIVSLLREAGASEIHVRVAAPPFLHPCYYGTDIDSRDNLIACHCDLKTIADKLGTDSLGYFPKEKLSLIAGCPDYCSACFSGFYPTEVPSDTRKNRFEQRISETEKTGNNHEKDI